MQQQFETPDLNNQTQLPNQPKINFKKSPVYIVILIIFAVFLGAFQIAELFLKKNIQTQPEQNLTVTDPTSDWKTYRNEELGFSITTPNEWVVEYNETYSLVSVLTKTYDPNYMKMGVPLATIYGIYIRPIEEYKQVQEECNGELLDTPDCRGILDLLGTNSMYAFTYHSAINTDYPTDFDKELFELGRISSKTFKFISTSTANIDTGDWKTYSNKLYKYEIKYPADWIVDNTNSKKDFEERAYGSLMGGDTFWENYDWNPQEPSPTPPDYKSLYLIVYKDDPKKTIDEYFGLQGYPNNYSKLLETRDIITSSKEIGRQYIVESLDHPVGHKTIITIFKLGSSFYKFNSEISSEDIHNQILSTFKLIQ